MLRVAVVHYHLRPGGVTQVIRHSLAALREEGENACRVVVLTGEPPSDAMPVPSATVAPFLGYSSSPAPNARALAAELDAAARHALGDLPDVWHVHNHALGKNFAVPALVEQFARDGRRLLLQFHDFAEDGRPANYRMLREHLGQHDALLFSQRLYPQGTHIHYALINERDRRFMSAAGVQAAQLHDLSNAVSLKDARDASEAAALERRLFLYPARGIRRKNLGEFLLWAAVAEPGDLFAVTRAPQNPHERPQYDQWAAFAAALGLPAQFSFGETWPGSFDSLLNAAHAIVTTSVAEGFGLGFLEPFLADRPLVGRKLPEITDAFERVGLDLSAMYAALRVPLAWVGRDRLMSEIQRELPRVYADYGRAADATQAERAFAAAVSGEMVDVGRLNEPLQQRVIERLARSPECRAEMLPARLFAGQHADGMIQRNRRVVEQRFHLREYGRRLRRIYETVAASPAAPLPALDADALLDQFLSPERFYLLRT